MWRTHYNATSNPRRNFPPLITTLFSASVCVSLDWWQLAKRMVRLFCIKPSIEDLEGRTISHFDIMMKDITRLFSNNVCIIIQYPQLLLRFFLRIILFVWIWSPKKKILVIQWMARMPKEVHAGCHTFMFSPIRYKLVSSDNLKWGWSS